jgi:hypothetical protein
MLAINDTRWVTVRESRLCEQHVLSIEVGVTQSKGRMDATRTGALDAAFLEYSSEI